MDRLKKLNVFYHDIPVGTLALYQNRLAAFENQTAHSRDFSRE